METQTVLEQNTISSAKFWFNPEANMTEKLLTST